MQYISGQSQIIFRKEKKKVKYFMFNNFFYV